MTEPPPEITRLLREAHEGRDEALDEVMELVYADLERLAQKHLGRRYGPGLAGATLEPSALVNETYLRLIKQRRRYDSRGHFFAIATKLMLRLLMDYERTKRRAKRGGDRIRVSLSAIAKVQGDAPSAEIPAFVGALERLESLSARTADVVKLRILWGLTMAETAEVLGLSVTTIEREWRFARRWLEDALTGGAA